MTYRSADHDPASIDPEVSARETARLRAEGLRVAQRKTDRRRRLLLRSGLVLSVLAVVVVVTLILVTVTRPSGRGPLNMRSDGIVLGRGFEAVRTDALRSGQSPVPTRSRSGVVSIRLYLDFFQPASAAFLKANRAQLRQYVDSGAATLEVHPIAIATTGTDGAQYSLRAANAAGCVAQFSPDRFWAFTQRLLERQPDPATAGLDDSQIVAAARAAGVTALGPIRDCIGSERFGKWVQTATARAAAGPLPGSSVRRVSATPTVLLDGRPYRSDPADAGAFGRAFLAAVGGNFSQQTTPSPTPSVSPTP